MSPGDDNRITERMQPKNDNQKDTYHLYHAKGLTLIFLSFCHQRMCVFPPPNGMTSGLSSSRIRSMRRAARREIWSDLNIPAPQRLSESNLIFSRETEEALRIKSAVLLIVLLTYATYQRTCTMSSSRDANQWINSPRKKQSLTEAPGGSSSYIWHLNCVIDMCFCTAVCTRGNWRPGVARFELTVSDSCGTTHFEWWLVCGELEILCDGHVLIPKWIFIPTDCNMDAHCIENSWMLKLQTCCI